MTLEQIVALDDMFRDAAAAVFEGYHGTRYPGTDVVALDAIVLLELVAEAVDLPGPYSYYDALVQAHGDHTHKVPLGDQRKSFEW